MGSTMEVTGSDGKLQGGDVKGRRWQSVIGR